MYVIRETFTAKPGQASSLARLLKQAMVDLGGIKARILTDYIAHFNTVVMETEVEELGAFEKMMADYASRQDVREKMKGYADMYTAGKREVYRVV